MQSFFIMQKKMKKVKHNSEKKEIKWSMVKNGWDHKNEIAVKVTSFV